MKLVGTYQLAAVSYWKYRAPGTGYYSPMARISVLTCSDKGAAGERDDESGEIIVRMLHEGGHDVWNARVPSSYS